MQAAKQQKWRTLPPWAPWAAGLVLVWLGSAALVYYWRAAFAPPAGHAVTSLLPALPATLLVGAVFSVVYGAVFLVRRFLKGKINAQAAVCVFLVGLLFVFAAAPLQSPDAERHYLRAQAVSMGRFNYDYQRGYPNDVNLLIEQFQPGMNHNILYGGGQMATNHLAQYYSALESGRTATVYMQESVQFMVVPYFLQAIFIAVARLFGFTALGQLYAARIANLLVYAFICYFVFKNCDKYRGVFFAVALLPMSLYMAASCSADGPMLALCYLLVSYFCKNEMGNVDLIVFGLAVVAVTAIKPNNVVLAFVLLLIPETRWKNKAKPWLALLLMVVVALAVWQGAGLLNNLRVHNYPQLPRGTGGANPTGQVAFVLQNPFKFIVTTALTLYEEAAFLFKINTFGTLDMPIPLASGLSVMVLCAASALGIQQQEDTKTTGAVALGLATLCYAGAVLLGIYVAESDFSSIRITGLQPRYFLPAILMFFMLASILLGKAVRPRLAAQSTLARTEQITLWLAFGVAVFVAILIFQNYFIGQWVPKGEGGWKMVNFLGWMFL